jgi:perosamine synthetase
MRNMNRSPVQLGVGTLQLSTEEKQAVMRVLDSNRLSYGPISKEFEQSFARAHDSKFAVLVSSGTSALRIAIACLKETEGWREGDEVLVPAVTFVATSNVVIDHGLTPVFVDCDPRTYNIDPTKIEEKITQRTRAIMHLLGQVADMDPILSIATKHDLRVIEDSAETMGVTYRGRKAGSFGDISCFSTYVAHLVVTGVGGFAITSNPRYAEILRSLANHGRDGIYLSIDDDRLASGEQFREIVRRRFRFIRPGYSFRLTEMEAAIGLEQLKKLPDMLQVRRTNAQFLADHLACFGEWVQLPWFDEDKQEHAFMMFPIVLCEGAPCTKDELVQHLEEWNIETRDMFPLINQPVYEHLGIRLKDYPVADWINRSGFYIGCHQGFSGKDLRYIVDVISAFFASHDKKKALGVVASVG